MRYDYYLSYSHWDIEIAKAIYQYLSARGVSVFYDRRMKSGESFQDQITNAIRNADGLIVLISDKSIQSERVKDEVLYAMQIAEERNKQIIPVIIDDVQLSGIFSFILGDRQFLHISSSDPDWVDYIFAPVVESLNIIRKKELGYEEYDSLKRSHLYIKASDKMIELIRLTLDQVELNVDLRKQYKCFVEVDRCLKQLHLLYDECAGDYSAEARQVTQAKLDMLDRIHKLYDCRTDTEDDLFSICCIIRFIYWDREIRWDCADMITHGDVSEGIVYTLPKSDYAQKQEKYRSIYLDKRSTPLPEQSQVINDFIIKTAEYLYDSPSRTPISKPWSPDAVESDERLQAIANYIREENHIFELIGEDQKAADFLKCLITSYERLKSYCEEIGAKELTAECISRIEILKQKYLSCSNDISEEHTLAEKGLRALLGFTRSNTGHYDVFLSHKARDFDIAQSVYKYLKRNLREVFFDRVSLPELSKSEYKNAILQALDRSRHFIVIVSHLQMLKAKKEEDESDWVQREMDLFHSELFEGRKENGNFIILVTDDVYMEIIDANKKNIDIKWRGYNLLRLSEYEDQILSYL